MAPALRELTPKHVAVNVDVLHAAEQTSACAEQAAVLLLLFPSV